MPKHGINISNFLNGLTKKEKDIYVGIYFAVAFAIVLVITAGICGFVTADEMIKVFNSQSNTEVVRAVGNSAGELKDMQERLQLIKQQFENIKYPNRGMMRDSINKDLAAVGFSVQSLTLRDLPIENIAARLRNGPMGTSRSEINASDIPTMIEVTVTGTLPYSSVLPFFKLADRTDRFWYIDTLDMTPPDGIADFFSKSFAQMPANQKKEMFSTFDLYNNAENPYMTITFSFYTFVKSGGLM